MGIDEVHRHEPRLLVGDGRRPVAQPRRRLPGDDRVDSQPGPGSAVDIPPVIPFMESIGLECIGGRQRIDRVDVGVGEMPLALVSAVVPGPGKHCSEGTQRRVERLDVGKVVVVVDPSYRDMAPGIDDRTSGAALRRGRVVAIQFDPSLAHSLPAGQDKAGGSWEVEPFLIGRYQQDVGGRRHRGSIA